MIEFKLPSLGADMDEGTLLEWKIKPGDVVERGRVVAVVDTAKAAIDVESWEEGTVSRLLVQPGEKIPVGTPMALFLAPGETEPTEVATTPAPPAAAPKAGLPPASEPEAAVQPAVGAKISPAARKRARELGVDLEHVGAGSGPGGSVVIADVERAAESGEAPPPADRAAQMRQTIAAAMSRSKREIPHYYLAETIPLRKATAWLAEENARRPMDKRLLMAVLFVKAVADALDRFPELNGFYRNGAFQPGEGIHVGVAIFLRDGGLVAPALHDVSGKNLDELMQGLTDLIQRARAGSLRSSELSDPTITVTSLGETGVELVHGVIYPPQVAIVGFGRVAPRPLVDEAGGVIAAPAVTATLAADHRVSDGHRGALFLATLRDALQQPEQLE